MLTSPRRLPYPDRYMLWRRMPPILLAAVMAVATRRRHTDGPYRGTPAGFSRLPAPVMVGAIRRANRKDLALLKSILEAGPA